MLARGCEKKGKIFKFRKDHGVGEVPRKLHQCTAQNKGEGPFCRKVCVWKNS